MRKSEQTDIEMMEKIIGGLDSRLDKKKFLERNESAFMIPKKFEYHPIRRDETELVQKPVLEVRTYIENQHLVTLFLVLTRDSLMLNAS